MRRPDPAALAEGVLEGSRAAIGRALTLVESTRPDHESLAVDLLDRLVGHAGGAIRIGLSGVPGVGKSTFLETVGVRLADAGHRVAVLAVDPSSGTSGGSILGDKTRMAALSVHDRAFVRPSPTAGTLGGVAAATRSAIVVMEAAGHDVVFVETVGVGQSETAVAGMTDAYLVLALPHAGDELQGIKKGILELADMVVVHKADVDPAAANGAVAEHRTALHLVGRGAEDGPDGVPVLAASSRTGDGLDEVWSRLHDRQQRLRDSGELIRRRADQDVRWIWEDADRRIVEAFRAAPRTRELGPDLEAEVRAGRLSARRAAARLAGPDAAG